MNKVIFRCPTCSKLYEVETNSVKSSNPHFDCLVCGEVFSFEFPPKDFTKIPTFPALKRQIASNKLSKTCPKCGALNQNTSTECYSCQIIFRQYELLKSESFPNAIPSLVSLWREYLGQIESADLRSKFINACLQLSQLDYAEAKFISLEKVMGKTEITQMALTQISELKQKNTELVIHTSPKAVVIFKKYILQKRSLYLGPLFLSALLILLGALQPAHRNMVGLAVAILMLHFGLILTIKGRITLSDFLK